jgi:hypothetical protein
MRDPLMRCSSAVALAFGLALVTAPPVRAHGVETSFSGLEASGLLRLQTSFSTGEPLANAEVRLQSPDGHQTLALGRTDADGRFQGRLPNSSQRQWELVVDGGPGHRDYLELTPAGPRAMVHHPAWPGLVGGGGLGATLALFGLLRHGQRQRRP